MNSPIHQRLARAVKKVASFLRTNIANPPTTDLGLSQDAVHNIGSNFAGRTYAIDVGASYYPHPAWEYIRHSSRACWVAIEPNPANLGYIEGWNTAHKCTAKVIPFGLNQSKGETTLFVTNIDSGSSLLPVAIPDDWKGRVNQDYFFPISEKTVNCITLQDAFSLIEVPCDVPVWIKLDTQGTENAIIKSLDTDTLKRQVILIETECTLQRDPIMQGAGKLTELIPMLEDSMFEMIYLKPIHVERGLQGGTPARSVLNECDIAFALSPSHAIASRTLEHNLSLISAYLSYGLVAEAAIHASRIQSCDRFELGVDCARNLSALANLIDS